MALDRWYKLTAEEYYVYSIIKNCDVMQKTPDYQRVSILHVSF